MDKTEQLKLFGHHRLTKHEREAVKALDLLYASKELQYIRTGFRRVPVFELARNATLKVIHQAGLRIGVPTRQLPVPQKTERTSRRAAYAELAALLEEVDSKI
jgi:hypothetical protein